MKIFLPACLLLGVALSGCSHHSNGADKQIATYSQTPHFIKSFLDTLYKGKFLIAEKGEHWTAGCVRQGSVPSRQFVSATMNSNRYELVFWQGGFVEVKKKLVYAIRRYNRDQLCVPRFIKMSKPKTRMHESSHLQPRT